MHHQGVSYQDHDVAVEYLYVVPRSWQVRLIKQCVHESLKSGRIVNTVGMVLAVSVGATELASCPSAEWRK